MNDTGSSGPGSATTARKRGGRRAWAIGLSALALTGLASAALIGGPGSAPAAAAGLRAFDGCQQVDDWFTKALADQVGPYGVQDFGDAMLRMATGSAPMAAEAAGADSMSSESSGTTPSAVGNGPNGTNVQEAGVDEGDVVKAANGLLVTTRESRLVVLDVSGERPRVLGRIGLPEREREHARWSQSSLLLEGDRVVVLTDISGYSIMESSISGDARLATPWRPTTVMTVVDIADPGSPRIVGSSEIEGSLVDARSHDGSVRVVTSSTKLPDFVPPSITPGGASSNEAMASATAENKRLLAEMSGSDFLPHVITRNADGVATATAPALACTAVSHPADFSGTSLVTVSTLRPGELRDGADPVVHRAGATANAHSVYATADRLYVTTNRWLWSTGSADSEQTEIHAFDTGSHDRTRYVASGSVRGNVIGQWAFSARDGVLRVATTRNFTGPVDGVLPERWTSDSAVSTFSEKGNRLVLNGFVDGLGKGEQIQSVRWFDHTAYVVTFRQIDPLYVVDLTDPANPRVTGELKVPGFSQYLHPIGDERLLGVGQAGDENGATNGLQVSTFDVSDPNAPAALDIYQRANASSMVQHASRAFTYLPESSTAILPGNEWNPEGWSMSDSGGRVFAFTVGQDGKLSEPRVLTTATCTPTRAVPVGSDRLAVLCGSDMSAENAELIITGTDLTETGRVGF